MKNKSVFWLLQYLTLLCAMLLASCPGIVHDIRNDDAVKVEIAVSGSLQNPAWSPDGTSLIFTRFRNGYNAEPADLYMVNLGTGALTCLVSDGSANVNLPGSAWNAVTGKIVFSSSRGDHECIRWIRRDAENLRER